MDTDQGYSKVIEEAARLKELSERLEELAGRSIKIRADRYRATYREEFQRIKLSSNTGRLING